MKTIELKLVEVNKKFTCEKEENPYIRYELIGHTEHDPTNLRKYSFFWHHGELSPSAGQVIRGTYHTTTKAGKTYEDIRGIMLLTDWGSAPVPPSEWSENNNSGACDTDTGRTQSILAQSDLHTASPIVAALLEHFMKNATHVNDDKSFEEEVKKRLIEYTLVCREARLELTKKYKELKDD